MRWARAPIVAVALVGCQVPLVGPPPQAPVEHLGRADLSDLAEGIRARVDEARTWSARDSRSHAVRAIEQAHRIAQVGRHRSDRFVAVAVYLEELREAMQNGHDGRARKLLAQPLTALDGVRGDVGGQRDPGADYDDATLLDARGQVLGEVVDLRGQDVVVRVGEGMDFLGFLDFGGREMRMPPHRLVFGEDRGMGRTWVVLAEPTSVRALKEFMHPH